MQKGVRARFEIISNILSGIVQGDNQKKRQSDEFQIEGAPESTPASSAVNKTKRLLPEAASTGLAFAAGALAVYFESAIKTAAEDLTKAVKKMLGFDVESSEGLLVDSLTTVGATDDEKEIEKEMSIIEARPGKEDDEIFESGPNDDTIEQLTDNIENETDNAIDDNEDDTQIPDEGYFPDLDDTEKEIEENLNNAEAEDEDTADPIRKTKAKPRVIKEAAPKPAPKKATPTSKKAGKSNTPKAKSARAAARKERPARVARPEPQSGSASSSASVTTGDPVKNVPNPDDDQGYPEQDNTSPAPTGTASKSLVDLIKSFEGFSPKAHPDYGQYSNGYGTKARSPTEEITVEEAERRLMDEIARFRGVVEQFSANKKYNWNSKQKDALTSFIYNLGAGALNQVTNNGTRSNSEIAAAMLLYDKAGGASLPGLTNRRKIEANVFNSSAVDEPEPTPSPAPPSGASESAPTAPTTPGAAVAAASEASEAPIKESKDVVINTPPENTSSGKTTGNQPKADITLSAGNSLARELAATHGTHSFGKTGTGTIAGI
jgi:GH24 family phage-related lysozyme (muramidase)